MNDRDVKVQRYPIRGALYGLLIGLSLAYFLFFQFAVFGFDSLGSVITKFVIVVLIGVVIGVAWAYLAPPKGPKAPPPTAQDDGPPPAAHDEGPPPAAATYDDEPPLAPDRDGDGFDEGDRMSDFGSDDEEGSDDEVQ